MSALGMEERLVAEVSKRVAARLQSQTRKEQVVDQLAERIMKRLTK
jgi:ethanolamine utilization protein EutQ (cupin superfamily)